MALYYFANPIHGGYVTFSAHLSIILKQPILKISNRFEPKARSFGWGCFYQNVDFEYFHQDKNVVILCLEKAYYNYLATLMEKLKNGENVKIITHDTVELKQSAIEFLQQAQKQKLNLELITIRQQISDYLAIKHGIESKFIHHPFYDYLKNVKNVKSVKNVKNVKNVENVKMPSISISRVDFDKHTEILIEANKLLEPEDKIRIYGLVNRIYGYHILDPLLKPSEIPFHKRYPQYKGPLVKSFNFLTKILDHSAYMVDMSAIKGDGGGTQYTFMEAIYNDVPLILSQKWTSTSDNAFIDGKNCVKVDTPDELAEVIKSKDIDRHKLVANSKKIIQYAMSDELKNIWRKNILN